MHKNIECCNLTVPRIHKRVRNLKVCSRDTTTEACLIKESLLKELAKEHGNAKKRKIKRNDEKPHVRMINQGNEKVKFSSKNKISGLQKCH